MSAYSETEFGEIQSSDSYSLKVGSYEHAVAKRSFHEWHRRCEKRALLMEQHLFEDEDSSEDESEAEKENHEHAQVDDLFCHEQRQKKNWSHLLKNYRLPSTFNPESDNLYFFWQFIVTVCLIYNAICIPLRSSFPYQTPTNVGKWLFFDYAADLFYLIDMVLFQARRQYLDGGCVEKDQKKTQQHYLSSWRFKRDMASVFPTDLLYLKLGAWPLVRINRLVKTDSYFEFNNGFEMMLKQAYIFRVVRITCYLLYFIHLDACMYYFLSYWDDFQSEWGYNQEGISYIRCYFWAFMTTITIGNVPNPTSTLEYIVQLLNYFGGLFIFSIVIGQVRDSVQAASADLEAYRSKKNACISYMQKNHIPTQVQKKVRLWFEYTWNTQKILDENALLKQMPGKMHTELAINVHMDVLSKVEIFKECDKQLLYDLLLKLQPILYLPGDYVCRKGEVGREMYIITHGMVQVVGESTSQVFATLYPGTAFGEISLLAIGGGNRRTANIYSPGYTTLFILYKQDLNEVVQNYPEAQGILKRKAKKMLNKDNVKKHVTIVSSSKAPPKINPKMGIGLIKTILDAAKSTNREFKNMAKIITKPQEGEATEET